MSTPLNGVDHVCCRPHRLCIQVRESPGHIQPHGTLTSTDSICNPNAAVDEEPATRDSAELARPIFLSDVHQITSCMYVLRSLVPLAVVPWPLLARGTCFFLWNGFFYLTFVYMQNLCR